MEIHLKRVYSDSSEEDGIRILVDRLWPRGLSKEKVMADYWLKDAAPSTELRRWFNHDPEKWDEFRKRYVSELKEKPELISKIRDILTQSSITLLYSARDTRCNQALALKEFLVSTELPDI